MYALQLSQRFLTIRPVRETLCGLWLDQQLVRECKSANEAALLVFERRTGHVDIDDAAASYPATVDGWQWISVVGAPAPVAGICAALLGPDPQPGY